MAKLSKSELKFQLFLRCIRQKSKWIPDKVLGPILIATMYSSVAIAIAIPNMVLGILTGTLIYAIVLIIAMARFLS